MCDRSAIPVQKNNHHIKGIMRSGEMFCHDFHLHLDRYIIHPTNPDSIRPPKLLRGTP